MEKRVRDRENLRTEAENIGRDASGIYCGNVAGAQMEVIMSPGRELDELVATKVMGLEQVRAGDYTENQDDDRIVWGDLNGDVPSLYLSESYDLPFYSQRIGDAWGIVEWLWKNTYARDLVVGNCCVEWDFSYTHYDQSVCGESTPHAICLAALRVIGEDV